jgi:uncharacterized repeat protein (TIGR03803 family)
LGTTAYGTIFAATTLGKEASIYTFNGSDGMYPSAGVTLATNGGFYGTAGGGSFGYGVLFLINGAGQYSVIHDFTGGLDGGNPIAPPVQAGDGDLYGTTSGTGAGSAGTVYKVTLSGAFSTIFTFSSDGSQGTQAEAPLLQAADGNLYGTANAGGISNCGTIFAVSRGGTLVFDYSFSCRAGGWGPVGPVLQASDGNFYGTTELGGSGDGCDGEPCGTVFKLSSDGAVTILYNFLGGRGDGAQPGAGLIEGPDGNLYGATAAGGIYDDGTLYEITLSGVESVLYNFPSRIGEHPAASLLQHTNGLLYGTTEAGGIYGDGALYSLDMGFQPCIAFVLSAGSVGRQAQILGQNLTGATSVTFNGVPATSFSVKSDTYMTAIVPAGATTGPVVVTTPTGTLTSNVNFRITQ